MKIVTTSPGLPYDCWDFKNMSVAELWDATRRATARYIYLGLSHMASECKAVKERRGGKKRVTYNLDTGNMSLKPDPAAS